MKMCNGTCQQGRKDCTCNYDEVDEIYVAFIKRIVLVTIIFVCLIGYLMVAA
jgi:hypothetical protein